MKTNELLGLKIIDLSLKIKKRCIIEGCRFYEYPHGFPEEDKYMDYCIYCGDRNLGTLGLPRGLDGLKKEMIQSCGLTGIKDGEDGSGS